MSMTENDPFLLANETRAPVWPAAARFRAFEWLRALANTDGSPEEAGIALDTWHNTAMDLQDVKAGVVMPKPAGHVLYENSDTDAPDSIKDRNGDIALALCRNCGRGEADLIEPCFGYTNPAGAVPEPKWLTALRSEVFMAPMKSNFTLSRDELKHILAPQPKGAT